MHNLVAFSMPGPFEFILLLAMIVIPLAVLFAIVFFAVKLAMRNKKPPQQDPQQR